VLQPIRFFVITLVLSLVAACSSDGAGVFGGGSDCDPAKYVDHCAGSELHYCEADHDCATHDCLGLGCHCSETPYVHTDSCDHGCGIVKGQAECLEPAQ
jgi:hypothetical protein